MSRLIAAHVLLEVLEADGVQLRIQGERLQWKPSTALVESEVALVRELKAELVELLPLDPVHRERMASWGPEEWTAFREERAGILEYQAGFTREEAERVAGLSAADPWAEPSGVEGGDVMNPESESSMAESQWWCGSTA